MTPVYVIHIHKNHSVIYVVISLFVLMMSVYVHACMDTIYVCMYVCSWVTSGDAGCDVVTSRNRPQMGPTPHTQVFSADPNVVSVPWTLR